MVEVVQVSYSLERVMTSITLIGLDVTVVLGDTVTDRSVLGRGA